MPCLAGSLARPAAPLAESAALLIAVWAELPESSLARPDAWLRTVLPNIENTPIAAMAMSATMMMYSVMPWPRWMRRPVERMRFRLISRLLREVPHAGCGATGRDRRRWNRPRHARGGADAVPGTGA